MRRSWVRRGVLIGATIAGLAASALPAEAGLGGWMVWRCAAQHDLRQCQSPSAPAVSAAGGEIALVNQDRAAAGMPALSESPDLDRIATLRAEDMAQNGYFSHYRPGSTTLAVLELLQANHIPFVWYGENIAWESGYPAETLLAFFNTAWMNSADHRANLLGPRYQRIGVGMAQNGARVYMVEVFTS